MAIYNQVLLYTFRDSLASGDPQKVIFGSYLDGEFGAIHNASLDAVSLSGNNTIAGNNSFTGTNTFSGAGITTTFSGKIVVGPPSSGTTMTVNVLDNAAITFSGPNSSRGYQLNFFDTTASAFRGFIGIGISTVTGAVATDFAVSPGAGGSVVIGTANGGAIATRFGPNGNVTINAPSSGSALTVTGASGTAVAQFNGTDIVQVITNSSAATNQSSIVYEQAGVAKGLIGADGNQNLVVGSANGDFIIRAAVGSGAGVLRFVTAATGASTQMVINAAGNVTINAPSSGSAVTVTAPAGGFATNAQGSGTASQSFGALVSAGTNSSDQALRVQNAAGSTQYFVVRGDGAILGGGPVAATLVDMTPDTGTFTGTFTGFTTGVTGTCTWTRVGKLVTLVFPANSVVTGTSNATTFTMTGLPAAIQPATLNQFISLPVAGVQNNGTLAAGAVQITAVSGTLTFWNTGAVTTTMVSSWISSGSKGFNTAHTGAYTISYLLN